MVLKALKMYFYSIWCYCA